MKHVDTISQLTLEEKSSLLSGRDFWHTKAIDRLNIPSYMLTDGPHGLRKARQQTNLTDSVPATCFPTASTLACSWNPALIEQMGACIGAEAAKEHVAVVLGPGLNIIRNPLGGRTFEYYSEDPYVSGEMASALVRGIQLQQVAACVKHFAVNSQEHLRMSIDEIVDERALHEIYLEGFRRAIMSSHPRFVMSSYNKINGTYANENRHLLAETLYGEWGYDGVVVTDWGANNDKIAGVLAGSCLEMPSAGGSTDAEVVAAVKSGALDEAILDERVDTLVDFALSTKNTPTPRSVDFDAHHQQAITAAAESIVLLKNEGATLPLQARTKVAVIGNFAKTPRYQGAGSSLVTPTRLVSPFEALEASSLDITGYAAGFRRFGKRTRRRDITDALKRAESADSTIVFVGLDESMEAEGLDRSHLQLSSPQLALIDELTKVHHHVIVVVQSGAPVEMPFINNPSVKAVIQMGLGGQGAGQAIADILTGAVNPSGRLAMSYPLTHRDAPSARYYPGAECIADHKESIFVGYRYYETANKSVLFPFGYGLSYTSFSYGGLHVEKTTRRTGDVAENTVLTATLTVTNTGDVAGADVIQLYVSKPNSAVFRTHHELKAFQKVYLEPGESKTIQLLLDAQAFMYFNPQHHCFVREAGEYILEIRPNAHDDAVLRQTILFDTDTETAEANANTDADADTGKTLPYDASMIPSYFNGAITNVSDAEFEALLGKKLPARYWNAKAPISYSDPVMRLRQANLIGRTLYGFINILRKALIIGGKPLDANNLMFITAVPFVKLQRISGGALSEAKIRKFLRIVNKGRRAN